MRKKFVFMAVAIAALSMTKMASAKEVEVTNNASQSIEDEIELVKNGFDSYSDWWNVGVIGHRKHVSVKKTSVKFYQEEIISYDTGNSTASELSYTKIAGFSTGYCVSFTKEVTKAESSAFSVKLGVPNAKLSNESEIATSYSISSTNSETYEYSEQYNNSIEITQKFDVQRFNVPSGCSYCIGTVGDYIVAEAESVEEKVWWGKTYQIENTRHTFTIKVIVYKYQTLIYSNGTFESAPERSYKL